MRQSVVNLEYESLPDLDGGALVEAFNQQIAAITSAICDRPTIKGKFEVHLVLTFAPVQPGRRGIGPQTIGVEAIATVYSKIPKLSSGEPYRFVLAQDQLGGPKLEFTSRRNQHVPFTEGATEDHE